MVITKGIKNGNKQTESEITKTKENWKQIKTLKQTKHIPGVGMGLGGGVGFGVGGGVGTVFVVFLLYFYVIFMSFCLFYVVFYDLFYFI
jgi:hypothetical protein